MAHLAILRGVPLHVVRHGSADRLRSIQIGLVARDTGRRQPLELADRRSLVAVVALHRSVRPQQREAVLVILHLLDRDIPALNRVALRAVRAHFPLVHVQVAVLAILSHVRENRFHVAVRAAHLLVHPAQRIPGFVVIKFRIGPDGLPCRRRVTVFARHR